MEDLFRFDLGPTDSDWPMEETWWGRENGNEADLLDTGSADEPVWLLKVPPHVENAWSNLKGVEGSSLGKVTMSMDPLNPHPTDSLQFTMTLPEKDPKAPHKSYSLNVTKGGLEYPMHTFSESSQCEMRVEGKVEMKLALKMRPRDIANNVPMEGLWRSLRHEIVELVLSFMPVPDLCRFRSVCKRWKEIISKPSFHDLCDLKGKKEVYLCVTPYLHWEDGSFVSPNFKQTLSFLDLDARRWYSIELNSKPHDDELYDTRIVAMDDGLACELIGDYETEACTGFFISNPVAKTRKGLLAPPIFWSSAIPRAVNPILVPVVDNVAHSFRIFLVNNSKFHSNPQIYVYESSTNKWRGLRDPPVKFLGRPGLRPAIAKSAVFNGALYTGFYNTYHSFVLLRYNLEENMWTKVRVPYTTTDPGNGSHCRLLVNNQLFMLVRQTLTSSRNKNWAYSRSWFEVKLIADDTDVNMPVLQITTPQLQQYFGQEYNIPSVGYVFPSIDSNGFCSSMVMMEGASGKLIEYDLVSGTVNGLPLHPFGRTSSQEIQGPYGRSVYSSYLAKHMNLSLRNLLS